MHNFFQRILRRLAVRILARYSPKVVAVTGSVGKTSTRSAIVAVLSKSFKVRGSAKNFNNEIGVPLTIIGAKEAPGSSPLAWLKLLASGLAVAYGRARPYPGVLVLEMGADHPGDLAYLVGIARPDVSVVTAVSEAHTEYFGDLEGVAKEKGTIVEALQPSGCAVLNADDPLVSAMASRTKARVIRFGFSSASDVRASGVAFEKAMETYFTRFDLTAGGETVHVNLSEAVGEGNVYAAAAAAAVARDFGLDMQSVPYGLAGYQPAPGRLRVLPGIKGTTIVDDSYNASPRAVFLALETFRRLPREGGRLIAALGDMLELGNLTEEAHRQVGRAAVEAGVELLVGVGPCARFICQGAIRAGLPEDRVFHLHTAAEAGHFLQDRIRSGDSLLIKGSQGMRMEVAVKELMAEPERAGELLVRQNEAWLKRG